MKQTFSFKKIFRQLIAFLLLINVGAGALSAQTGRKTAAQSSKNAVPAKAGWSGVITYRKTLNDTFASDEKLFGRLDERERIKHNDSRNYAYEGRMIVNDFAGTGRATTQTKIGFSDNNSQKVVQTELTNCHSWEPERLITAESTDRKITYGTGDGEAYSYSLSVNGDKFSLGFTFPEFQGKYTHTTNSTYKNLCPDSTRKPEASTNDDVVRIERGGASIEGNIDPKNPDVLEGSKSWFDTVGNKKSFVYTVTWKLRRKPVPLMITDIKFYQPIYPSPNDWHEIPDEAFAVDGNQVKIVATIANFGATEKSATVNFKELKENVALPDGTVTASVPANGQKDVEMIWDTSGYAWRESGADVAPETNRQIEAKIPDDVMEKDLTVIPKPVVLVWGFWQSPDAFKKFRNYFKAVSDKWAVWDGMTDVRKVSTDNADALDETVRKAQKYANAWHVDLVAVQNGGLTGRVYVNSKMPTLFDGRPAATHLIMIGTPNKGTPCATGIFGLSFKLNTFNMDAVAELAPDSMKRFNLLVNNTNGTKFAALVNHSRDNTCQGKAHGDGFTSVKSAVWRTKTNAETNINVNTRDYIGEVAPFRQVYKWLAVPPKGDHNPDPSTLAANFSNENLIEPFENNFGKTRNYGASFAGGNQKNNNDDDEPKPDFAKVVALPGKKTTEIEIPVSAGSEFALNFFTSPEISVTLLNDKGETIGTNLANSPESADIFRSITVEKTFQSGKWKLKIENPGKSDSEILITAFVDYNSKVAAGK